MSEDATLEPTLADFYKIAALALPQCRPSIVDLAAKHAELAICCSTEATHAAYLLDAENLRSEKTDLTDWHPNRVQAEIVQFYPLLADVQFRSELFVLKPPAGLFAKKDLARLGQSRCQFVRKAYESSLENIDSSIAYTMIALDLCSQNGEVLCIAPVTALSALGKDCPQAALAYHLWAKIIFKETVILYFALDHNSGAQFERMVDNLDQLRFAAFDIRKDRGNYRGGKQCWSPHDHDAQADDLWRAAKAQHNAILGRGPRDEIWNLFLKDGKLNVYISLYDRRAPSTNQKEAVELPKLSDKTLVDIVLNRATRDLMAKALKSCWRVEPGLRERFDEAVKDGLAAAAPLYPLNFTMSMAFIEDLDSIECKATMHAKAGGVLFRASQSYRVTTQSVKITRLATKPSPDGTDHQYLMTGKELAIFIVGEDGKEHNFLDARHHAEGIDIEGERLETNSAVWSPTGQNSYLVKVKIIPEFKLDELVGHFVVPTAPDVAAVQPLRYQEMLGRLDEIERRVALRENN